MGRSRSYWNGTTSALQLEEITSKGTSFMCVLSIKVPIRKKSGNLSYVPRIYRKKERRFFCGHFKQYRAGIYIYIYIYIYKERKRTRKIERRFFCSHFKQHFLKR